MRELLIDGDVLVYESSFGAQRNRYTITYADGERTFENAKDRDTWLKEVGLKDKPEEYTCTKHLDVLEEGLALLICQNKLNALCEKLEADRFNIFLTGKGNYREEVATIKPYKGNRSSVEKPVHFAVCREWFENHTASVISIGEEADDLLGIEQTKRKGEGILCSIDKDLMQIRGNHYNWNKDIKFRINADASDRWFWLQMLMGDTADNIPGIPKIGEVKAHKMIDGLTTRQDRCNIVVEQYKKTYGESWSSALHEVGQLLWIRRDVGQAWNLADYLAGSMKE